MPTKAFTRHYGTNWSETITDNRRHNSTRCPKELDDPLQLDLLGVSWGSFVSLAAFGSWCKRDARGNDPKEEVGKMKNSFWVCG